MDRNKTEFWYSYLGEETTDEYGNDALDYTNPIQAWANISATSGAVSERLFGKLEAYSKVINPLPKDFPIEPSMRLWVDTMPTIETDGSTNTVHDYEVVLPAEGLNHRFLAIRRVTVT